MDRSRARRHLRDDDRHRPGRRRAAPPRTQAELAAAGLLPRWLGDERLHRSHRAALVRKDPERYGRLFPDADPAEPYFWPTGASAAS